MNDRNFPWFNPPWDNINSVILTICTNCSRPVSGRRQKRLHGKLRNIKGFDLISKDSCKALQQSDHTITSASIDELPLMPVVTVGDFQKGIQAVVSLFLDITRPSKKEDEKFTILVSPILDQMDALHIPSSLPSFFLIFPSLQTKLVEPLPRFRSLQPLWILFSAPSSLLYFSIRMFKTVAFPV